MADEVERVAGHLPAGMDPIIIFFHSYHHASK